MSVSKLESLPNEILLAIFENYMNWIDVLNTFAVLPNRRFVKIVTRCHHIRLDFIKCRKDSFCYSLEILQNYAERIEELRLGEENAPGQVYVFLLAFPSFASFKQLTQLHLNFEDSSVEWTLVKKALRSLKNISLTRLSIKTTNAFQSSLLLNDVFVDLLCLKTLRQLVLVVDFHQIRWTDLVEVSSNVERLTILGVLDCFEAVEYIFRCIPRLTYLHMRTIDSTSGLFYQPMRRWNDRSSLMDNLHTLNLECAGEPRSMFDMLKDNSKRIPNLYRLKIKTIDALCITNIWETLLTTLFPSLVHFDLHMTTTDTEFNHVTNSLTAFQTLFWIERRNFNILVTRQASETHKPIDPTTGQPRLSPHVVQWWLAPFRGCDDNFSLLKNISGLSLSVASKPLQRYYYFENVKELVVNDLDSDLFEWISKYLNYSRVKSLDISKLQTETITIYSFLSRLMNISTLRMTLQQLLNYCDRSRRENTCLKSLDLSSDRHKFERANIEVISKLFPNLEHLSINTQSLHNVPMLQNYLPYLRSLTFLVDDVEMSSNHPDQQLKSSSTQLEDVHCWIKRKNKSITVWLDWTSLEPYWSAQNR